MAEFQRAVDEAFDRRAADLPRWADPHPDRMPFDEEYSRVTDPERWRIVPARAEAWCEAAVALGAGTLQRDVAVRWATDVRMPFERVDRLVPRRPDAVPLVLGYSAFEHEEGPAGVTLGIGDPAVVVAGPRRAGATPATPVPMRSWATWTTRSAGSCQARSGT